MIEDLKSLRDAIDSFLEKALDLEDVTSQLDVAKAQLLTTTKQHDDISAALADKTLLLDSARADAAKAHDKEMYEKSEELKKLKSQVDTLASQRDQLKVECDSARIEHEGIEASLESLRKKHFA